MKKLTLVLVLCVIGLASGCGHSLIQEDGVDRHVAKIAINKKDGFLVSLFGGSTNTRFVTNETEETLQTSPTIREAELYRRLIAQGQGELASTMMHGDSERATDSKLKNNLIRKGHGQQVADALNR